MFKPAPLTEMKIWVAASVFACLVAEISHALSPAGLTWFSAVLLASPALMFICFYLYLRHTFRRISDG